MKTLCVTGHRPDGLPWKNDLKDIRCSNFIKQLEEYLIFAILNGYTHFIAGGALGIDTLFALSVIKLKEEYPNITLEIAVPCETQSKGWNSHDKSVYNYILKNADKVTCLSQKYYVLCMQKRNEYMVNGSDCVLCCYNGVRKGGTYNTIKFAQKNNKKLLFINLSENAKNGGNELILFTDKII